MTQGNICASGRRARGAFVLVAAVWVSAPAARAQEPAADGVSGLLERLEQAIEKRDGAEFDALLSPNADPARAQAFKSGLIADKVTNVTIRERNRMDLPGALPGEGYELLAEALIEYGPRARIATWRLDVRSGRPGPQGTAVEWLFSGVESVTALEGLHRLSLSATTQFRARDLSVQGEDFALALPSGSVFVAEVNEGATALVILGRGVMTFTPAPATERGQVKIFSGRETLQSPFTVAFVRVNPSELESRVSMSALAPVPVDAREFRRALQIFEDELPKSFSLDLRDLSRHIWSLVPPYGDFVVEVRTKNYDALTYARSGSEAEDITLFDRKRSINIAVYASKQKLATRGRFYNEDDLSDIDVLDYQVDATFTPEREWIEGEARVKLRVRSHAVATLTLRLAESLTARRVLSRELGPLLHVRVRNQTSFVINLPAIAPRGTELTLTIQYGGRLPAQPAPNEALMMAQRYRAEGQEDVQAVAPERSFLYSNRSHWYPQASVSDYATATLRLTVPGAYSCVASGEPAGAPEAVTLNVTGRDQSDAGRRYTFTATQPVRYLATVISRFVRVNASAVTLGDDTTGPDPPAPSAGETEGALAIEEPASQAAPGTAVQMAIEANPRQQGRGRELSQRAADIMRFYSTVMGDYPYPSFTLAIVENNLPGGHSPAYFAALNQPLPTSPFVWRNDPASFPTFPEFFIAHELAHQWWGQAVGWKNFHEQWISEGFAQYFAALYARHARGAGTLEDVMRHMRKWAMDKSDQGPVHLGYRLGHVKRDSRVFRALVYNKGAMVLHMLRRLLGDQVFFQGLRRFYADSRFRKAGTDDVQKAFEAESGRSLDRFFERWILGSAVPRVRYSAVVEGGELALKFEQLGEVFDLPVTVTVEYADREVITMTVPLTEQVVITRVPVAGPVRSIGVNRDHAALGEFIKGGT